MKVIENHPQGPDSELLRAYRQSGSHEAFGAISRKYYGFILGICHRELRNDEMAKDAAQEVLLELMRRANRLEAKDGLAPWLFRAAISRSRDLARSEARRRKREERYERAASASEEDYRAINELLGQLPDGERNALLLRFVGGYSFEEIGTRFGLSADAARMRVNRGLDRLRQGLAAGGFALSAESTLHFETKEPPRLNANAVKPRLPIHHAKWIAISGAVAGSLGTIALIGNPIVASSTPAEPDGGGPIFAKSAELEGRWLPFYAEVELTYKGGVAPLRSKYWRDAQQIRVIETWPDKVIHVRADAKEALSMAVTPRKASDIEGRIIKGRPNQIFVQTDVWEAGLLQLPVLVTTRIPASPWLLKEALGSRKATGEVVLNHPDGKRTYRLTFDSAKGDMASRCVYMFKGEQSTEFKFDIRVTEWQQVDGRWFPKQVRRNSWFNGNPSQEATFEIKNVKVGKDVPSMAAMPKPERNAIVLDEVRSVWYRVDENWKKLTQDMPTTPVSVGGGGG